MKGCINSTCQPHLCSVFLFSCVIPQLTYGHFICFIVPIKPVESFNAVEGYAAIQKAHMTNILSLGNMWLLPIHQ